MQGRLEGAPQKARTPAPVVKGNVRLKAEELYQSGVLDPSQLAALRLLRPKKSSHHPNGEPAITQNLYAYYVTLMRRGISDTIPRSAEFCKRLVSLGIAEIKEPPANGRDKPADRTQIVLTDTGTELLKLFEERVKTEPGLSRFR